MGNAVNSLVLLSNERIVAGMGGRYMKVISYRKMKWIESYEVDDEIDLIVADLSFISEKTVLPVFKTLLKENGHMIILIKPQFELEKNKLTKSGIVKSDKLRETAKEGIIEFATALGFTVSGVTETPRLFDNKNVEYLVYLKK